MIVALDPVASSARRVPPASMETARTGDRQVLVTGVGRVTGLGQREAGSEGDRVRSVRVDRQGGERGAVLHIVVHRLHAARAQPQVRGFDRLDGVHSRGDRRARALRGRPGPATGRRRRRGQQERSARSNRERRRPPTSPRCPARPREHRRPPRSTPPTRRGSSPPAGLPGPSRPASPPPPWSSRSARPVTWSPALVATSLGQVGAVDP